MIGLINYGMGNLGSVKRTFDILKINNKIIKQPGEVLDCDEYS
jgi:imidazoleglycerol phosphate synthase glutamine amidotransferase subunit HisH